MKISQRVSMVRADNPGVMTLDGTNTWILREGAGRSIVIDPGPLLEDHLDAVVAEAGEIGLIVSTHRHYDHTESVAELSRRVKAPACAVDPQFCVGSDPLSDGDQLEIDGLLLDVLLTPGHTTDSTSLWLSAENALFSGDTILGRGTTVVAYPDGALAAYLDSLAKIRQLIDENAVEQILPGHGPVIDDPARVVDYYIEHRYERLDQVRQAQAAGASTAREVVETVYADVDEALWPAAELSVQAQLEYLREE